MGLWGRAMSYSMSEIESHCRKAARGAGLSWGEAEEAGQAVRRLCAAGLAGADALLAYLTARDAGTVKTGACPIKLGSQMIDGANPALAACHSPLLLLPFLSLLAEDQGIALALQGRVFHGMVTPEGGIHLIQPASEDTDLSIRPTTAPTAELVWRAKCAQDTYDALNLFCQRTYAPETDASRAKGAGAGEDGNS